MQVIIKFFTEKNGEDFTLYCEGTYSNGKITNIISQTGITKINETVKIDFDPETQYLVGGFDFEAKKINYIKPKQKVQKQSRVEYLNGALNALNFNGGVPTFI
jgi:hypothetical protein